MASTGRARGSVALADGEVPDCRVMGTEDHWRAMWEYRRGRQLGASQVEELRARWLVSWLEE